MAKSQGPTGYLTQREFARLVDDPLQTVIDKDRLGLFEAAIPGGGRGHKKLYTYEQVEEYKKLKVSMKDPNAQMRFYTIEEAYAGFMALDEGKTIREMVVQLKIHPAKAEAIRADWVRAGEGVILDRKHVEAILSLGLSGPSSITRPEDVVEIVVAAAAEAEHECACKRAPASVCLRCVHDRVKNALLSAKKSEPTPSEDDDESGEIARAVG